MLIAVNIIFIKYKVFNKKLLSKKHPGNDCKNDSLGWAKYYGTLFLNLYIYKAITN